MTKFEHTVRSVVDVSTNRDRVWDALSDPDVLTELAPLVSSIEADGVIWHWRLARIAAIGHSIAPSFTELMSFDQGRRIGYTHQPPSGRHERAGAEGAYELCDIDGGTRVQITLTICLDLPLPVLAKPAVRRVMMSTMERSGRQFGINLLRHLDADDLAAERR